VIPALLAIPLVEGVAGSVMNCFAPSAPAAPDAATGSNSFSPYLNRAAGMTAAPQLPSATAPSGTMRADQWSQMDSSDTQTWLKGLAGRHVDATDDSGRTISGVVSGVQQLGNTLAINVGGHLVSLSQLKQVTWSPAVA
jgi:hypothetical protein